MWWHLGITKKEGRVLVFCQDKAVLDRVLGQSAGIWLRATVEVELKQLCEASNFQQKQLLRRASCASKAETKLEAEWIQLRTELHTKEGESLTIAPHTGGLQGDSIMAPMFGAAYDHEVDGMRTGCKREKYGY